MIVSPKVRGFICINSHPQGCAANVQEQIAYIKSNSDTFSTGNGAPKNVLIIGSSTGYGLASRITAAFGYGANTLGLFFEKPPTDRTATKPTITIITHAQSPQSPPTPSRAVPIWSSPSWGENPRRCPALELRHLGPRVVLLSRVSFPNPS